MSTRPAPRPRPRPRPVAHAQSSTQPASSGSGEVGNTHIPVAVDDDDRFIKNRWRNAQEWKKLNELAKGHEKKQSKNSDDDDSGVEMDTPHKRKQKRTGKGKDTMPDWTKNADAILISSDDEIDESILQQVDDITDADAFSNLQQKHTARLKKRPRSRSRSITPPPQLSTGAIMHAKETVRRLLNAQTHSSSAIELEDEDDTADDSFVLEPELARIARKVEIEVMRQSSTPGPERSPSPQDVGGPPVVTLKVNWTPHPLNTNAAPEVWGFKMRRNDAFRTMFNEIADLASILIDNVVVNFDGKRIYPSASPHGIGVWSEAELDACDKVTYEYLRSRRYVTSSVDNDLRQRGRSLTGTTPPPSTEVEEESGTEADSGSEDDDTIRLTFRSGFVKDIMLKVRPTTKCSAILKAYLKKAGLPEKYPSTPKAKGKKGKPTGPALAVDGDRLDPDDEIGKADLEDGDQVEVVGL